MLSSYLLVPNWKPEINQKYTEIENFQIKCILGDLKLASKALSMASWSNDLNQFSTKVKLSGCPLPARRSQTAHGLAIPSLER